MTAQTPYVAAARAYIAAGWGGVLPLPERRKERPPSGYTGRDGRWPTPAQIERWIEGETFVGYIDDNGQPVRVTAGNIALRVPDDVIGIDLDTYKVPNARANLEAITGPLPPTWCSTSRVDGSGIRFYRVPRPPAGKRWANVPTPGVEIVQHTHRYAVVWPSIHPDTDQPYKWIDEAAGEVAENPPQWDDLTELPWRAVEALLVDDNTGDTRTPTSFTLPDGPMTDLVRRKLTDALSACHGDPGSRHDRVRDAVLTLVRLGERGETGVQHALDALGDAFIAAVAPDRPGGERSARAEYDKLVRGAERIVAGTVGRIPTREQRLAEREARRREHDPSDLIAPPKPADAPNPDSDDEAPPREPLAVRPVPTLATDMPEQPPTYIEGLMRRGEMVVIGAPRAIGKSWLAMNLAAKLARGEGALFDHLPVKAAARVLLLQGELDEWGSATRWLKLHENDRGGIDPLPPVIESFDRRVRIRTTKRRTTTSYEGETWSDEYVDAVLSPLLEEAIIDHKIDVVIIDPWATYFAGNENSNDEVEAALDKLRGLTLKHGVSWVIFHHISKATEWREPEDAWRGASRLADWASTRMTILPHYTKGQADEAGLERHIARRFVDVFMLRRSEPTPDFSMHLDPDGWWRKWDPPEGEFDEVPKRGGRPPEIHDLDVLRQLAADHGRWPSIQDGADRTGGNWRSVKKALDRLAVAGLVKFVGHGRSIAVEITEAGWDKAGRPAPDVGPDAPL